MLSGDNGILQKATDAKTKSDEAQIKERIQLAELSARIDGKGDLLYSKLNEELAKEFGDKGTGYNISEETENPWIVTVESVEYNISHTDIGDDVTLGFGTVNEEYINQFGYLVTGYTPTSGTNWRLFYADSNNAYLISDIITNAFTEYENSTISELGSNLNNEYTENSSWELKTDGTNINNNIKAVATLSDTTKWLNYKASLADWAIGSPSLEMFVKSYNATHTKKINCIVDENSTGYKVGINTDGGEVTNFDSYMYGFDSTDLDKAIYQLDDNIGFWWLCSPSVQGADSLICSGHNIGPGLQGQTVTDENNMMYTGVRPLVSIPLSKITNGTITITNKYFND